VTDVRATVTESRHGQRAKAHIKASAGLEAAIRAEAREAARAEVRERIKTQPVTGRVTASLRARTGDSRINIRTRSSGDEAVALLQLLRTAWETGGPARANALLEFVCGTRSDNQTLPPELAALLASLEEHASLHGHVHFGGHAFGGGNGTGQVETGAHGNGTGQVEAGAHGNGTGQVETGAHGNGTGQGTGTAPGGTVSPFGSNSPGGTTTSPTTSAVAGASNTQSPESASPSLFQRESGSAPSSSSRQLPFTGLEVGWILALGFGAVAAGAALRRRTGAPLR
jgi:hypothetical protein